MTRSLKFKGAGKDYASVTRDADKVSFTIMGKKYEASLDNPWRESVKSFGQTLIEGSPLKLQNAAKFVVQLGEYTGKRAYAYANIAGQVASDVAKKVAPTPRKPAPAPG